MEEQFQKAKREIEIKKMFANFIEEIAKKGHKKVTKKIETYFKEFLEKNKIEYSYVFYSNDNRKYDISTCYDLELGIRFKDMQDYKTISLMRGWTDNECGGYYDNIINASPYYKMENIIRDENKIMEEFENAFNDMEEYNKKLKELAKMQKKYGYLARN